MKLARIIRENRATVVCGLLVALALAVGFALTYRRGGAEDQLVALVHDADGVTHELPLDVDGELQVTTQLGSNTIVVQDGSVRMEQADCPNGTCLREAPLSEPGRQIICLPHELWIEVVPAGTQGGELDVSLASTTDDLDLVAR